MYKPISPAETMTWINALFGFIFVLILKHPKLSYHI